jgi:hypothetical protein
LRQVDPVLPALLTLESPALLTLEPPALLTLEPPAADP